MKIFSSYFGTIGVICVVATLLFTGAGTTTAAENGYLDVPIPREFVPAVKTNGEPLYVSDKNIENNIRKFSPNLKKFFHNKKITQFIVPEKEWLKHLLGAYDVFLSYSGLVGEADTWDCENFSSMLNAISTLTVWEAGYFDTKAAIGWLRVDAKKEWAGLPGVMHSLMFAVTKGGIFIIEPQNGQYVALSKYPNRQYIEEVYLF